MLLGLVLVIWGIVGYKIISTIKPTPPNANQQYSNVVFNPNINTQVDTFSIQLLGRDPFLGTLYYKKKLNPSLKINKPKEDIVWIPVIYHGTVSKQDSKEKICVLSINGQQHIMKIGQEMNGVKLIKANNIEVIVSYKDAKKTIIKT